MREYSFLNLTGTVSINKRCSFCEKKILQNQGDYIYVFEGFSLKKDIFEVLYICKDCVKKNEELKEASKRAKDEEQLFMQSMRKQ